MATAEGSQYDVTSVASSGVTQSTQSSQYDITVIFNVPSEQLQASQYDASLPITRQGDTAPVEASQYDAIAIIRGRVFNPSLRAWWFELDGHEFYVLNLGATGKTLVYDLTTDSWAWWSVGDLNYWRAAVGTNWTESKDIAYDYGSSVVVGDDTAGILWILNPEQGYDEALQEADRESGDLIPFTRKATGQVLTKGRITIPCYQVYTTVETGRPAYTGASVTLSYSDDQGNTFTDAGSIVSTSGNYLQEFAWRSLGLIQAPGRLFRLTDDGAFPKIEELIIYDGSATA